MKAAGFLCNIDGLGRIVIPKTLRKQFGLDKGDCLEIFTDEDSIIMKRYSESCIFCGGTEKLTDYMDKCVCEDCIKSFCAKTTKIGA